MDSLLWRDSLVVEFGLSLAEIARQLGVSLSAIAKSLQNRQTE